MSANALDAVAKGLPDLLASATPEASIPDVETPESLAKELAKSEGLLAQEEQRSVGKDSVGWLLDLVGNTRVPSPDEQVGYIGLARMGKRAAEKLERKTEIPAAHWRAHARYRIMGQEPPSFLRGLERLVPKGDRKLYLQLLQGEEGTLAVVEGNLKLVFYVLRKYMNPGNPLPNDLFGEGVMGLFEAVDRYNPKLGYRFSTYAFWWIRQRISRELKAQRRGQADLQLDEPVNGDAFLGDFLTSDVDPASDAIEAYAREQQRRKIAQVLTPAQAAVVFLKYGLATGEPSSTRKVAQALGFDPGRVMKILREAEKRLRHALGNENHGAGQPLPRPSP